MSRERPIIFSAPMVLAILDGRKTQTRLVVKPQPRADQIMPSKFVDWRNHDAIYNKDGAWHALTVDGNDHGYIGPYGVPGDRLWVREVWRAHELTDKEARDDAFGVIERLGLEHPLFGLDGVVYEADGAFQEIKSTREAADQWGAAHANGKHGACWRPSMFMPRWASRITLEVTGVRVERVQAISAVGAWAEGIPHSPDVNPLHEYAELWDHLNAKRGHPWASNPLVWVIEFKVIGP